MSRDIAAYLPLATNSNDTEFRYWLNKSGPWGWTELIGEDSSFVFQQLTFSGVPGAFVAEQFTGHVAVGGNKIFEGDFLIFPEGSESVGHPEDLLYLVCQSPLYGWCAKYIMPGTTRAIEVSLKGTVMWRVVGNIHEGIKVRIT